ncbi:MAG: amidohydrolase [Clostridia bacterium]|nr:amidohydrolase [Clostridia bacterium]
MGILNEAKRWQKEFVEYRRYLHEHAEAGFALEKTVAFVEEKLKEMDYTPQKCGKAGLTATVGKGNRTFLLRADMDGLPIREQTRLPFACKSGNMHACGHDMHTAMLLGAARLLKAHERELKGTIKLLFQPAEELLQGAQDCIEGGVLRGVNGAMMLHVMTATELPVGTAVVASSGVSAPAADYFTIQVQGKSCHGSAPWNGVDALTAAAHLLVSLQEISAREISLAKPAVLTVGTFSAGSAPNVIADSAILKGTLRAFDEETRDTLKKRLTEIAKGTAKAFRARAKITFDSGCPTLVNDSELSAFAESAAKDLLGEQVVFNSAQLSGGSVAAKNGGSEDFAYISQEIPSVMLALSAGEINKGYEYPLHHPKAVFDENAICYGAGLYAHIAMEWLKNG